MSTPVPIKQWSIDEASAKTNANACSSIWSGKAIDEAQIPLGRHNSDPRCDMPANRKPPLP
jgi:hypothetical protein